MARKKDNSVDIGAYTVVSCGEIITNQLIDIRDEVNRLLTDDRKSFDITFHGVEFKFQPACTSEEQEEQAVRRQEFISILLKTCLNECVDQLFNDERFNPWDRLHSLFAGPDPDDFKMDKAEIQEILEEASEKYGTARPLNLDSYQVKMQDVFQAILEEEEEDVITD